jgi:uncharacterized RDD family membrane protein YckC
MRANEPAESRILGLDNVPLDLPVAGAPSRALAAFLDYLVLMAILMVVFFVGIALVAALSLHSSLGAWLVGLLIVGFFLVEYGYFAGVEIAMGGSTFGKWVMGLRVVTAAGGRPGVAALLLRNCVRSVDLVVGVPLMILDPRSRRLGDRLAGTLVVHRRAREPELVLRRTPQGWGSREAALLEGFLRRAAELEPARADHMARLLLARIERDDATALLGLPEGLSALDTLRRAFGPEGA